MVTMRRTALVGAGAVRIYLLVDKVRHWVLIGPVEDRLS
jgi:hypothetical protein